MYWQLIILVCAQNRTVVESSVHFIVHCLVDRALVLADQGRLDRNVQVARVARVWRHLHLALDHVAALTVEVLLEVEHHLLKKELYSVRVVLDDFAVIRLWETPYSVMLLLIYTQVQFINTPQDIKII